MNAPAIRLQGLRKNFGASEIIRGVDLDIHRGERHAIICLLYTSPSPRD